MTKFTWVFKKNEKSPYFEENRLFYICSYGGCGSFMLFGYLSNFGTTFHIHCRNMPDVLKKIDSTNRIQHYTYEDNWDNHKPVEEDKIKDYKVIYIYRDPIKAMYSVARRFPFHLHMKSIQCMVTTKTLMKPLNKRRFTVRHVDLSIHDFKRGKRDICGLENFFDNYTQKRNRNYNIYCIKYENFFEDIKNFNDTLEVEDVEELYPVKKENIVDYENYEELKSNIYKNLFTKINNLPSIYLV